MKRLAFSLATLSILIFACTISRTATPVAGTNVPMVSETPIKTQLPTASEPPVATEPPAHQTNITCNGLALFLDPALASGYNCEIVPASTEGMDMYPEYTQLTLQGYVLPGAFFTAHISIYSVEDYTNLLPINIPTDVANLHALISGGPTGNKGLPLLPNFNAGQEFFARYKVTSFGSGNGIRVLTQYSQNFDPINNHEMFYTFQGLTSDGKYWISAILPISNPILPADGNNLPNGQSQEEFGNNYATYIADLTNQLNSQPAENYAPSLVILDALVTSLRIQP